MPRDLSLDASGRMLIKPVPEIANLQVGEPQSLTLGGPAAVVGSQAMVSLECTGVPRTTMRRTADGRRARHAVGVDVLLDTAAGEWTRVGYDLETGILFVDQ